MYPKYKILVVDDQRDNLLRIVEMIEEKYKDWEILHALDGLSAINISKKEKPDIIILDWEMPGLNGIETTTKLKEDVTTSEIPVIICTGKMTSSRNLETAFSAGAVDYIRKPIDKIELLARLQSVLLLSESYKRIKQLNENKNKLLSIIAHDLKNPLYTVKLLIDLVNNKKTSTERRTRILQGVSSSVTSAYHLLENLLAWANSQRNTIIYLPERTNLFSIIETNLDILKLDAAHKSIIIDCQIDEELVIFADKNMISTVIRNLLSNAIKFTPRDGTIHISSFSANNQIEILIKDTGKGISEHDLKILMEEDASRLKPLSNNELGAGLGIQICKEFIKIHHGSFLITSKVNEGTLVKITLPVNSFQTD